MNIAVGLARTVKAGSRRVEGGLLWDCLLLLLLFGSVLKRLRA